MLSVIDMIKRIATAIVTAELGLVRFRVALGNVVIGSAPAALTLPHPHRGGGSGSGGYLDFEEEREERQEKLLELLKQVRPETWDDAGGRGTISAFGGKIVITQTLEIHEIIGGRFAYTENLYP